MGWEMPWYTMTDRFDKDFGVDEWHGHNVFFRETAKICSAYTSSTAEVTRAMGSPPGSYL